MDEVDASIDFLKEYTKALTLAALDNVIANEQLKLQCTELEQEALMNKILDLIADKFTLPPIDSEMDEGDTFQCKDCGRKFKKVASLCKHQKTKHNLTAAPKSKKPIIGESERICPFCCKDYKKSANLKKHIERSMRVVLCHSSLTPITDNRSITSVRFAGKGTNSWATWLNIRKTKITFP